MSFGQTHTVKLAEEAWLENEEKIIRQKMAGVMSYAENAKGKNQHIWGLCLS